ncbi:MAG: hypothetical protein ACKPEY_16785, partial [Planctomycetota bacterium]
MVRNLGFAAVLATLYWIAPLARSLWGFSEPLFSRTVGNSPIATITSTTTSATTSTTTSAREIHVDPRGDDKNSGTVDKPVASLLAAQALARTARGAVVVVHGGTYRLERRWEFTPADHEVTI